MHKPLLSHVIAARNDNYLGNFKQRLEMCINYICKNVVETGNQNNYELIIVDWNSESPLRHELYLTKEAMALTKFVEAPATLIKQLGLDGSTFIISSAMNLGIRHATADMILISPADILMPHVAVKNLFSLLKKEIACPIDIHNCYMGIERFLIPWQLSARMTLDSIDNDLFMYSNALELAMKYTGIAAGEGGHLISKKVLEKINAFDESMPYWGGQEVQLAMRINQFAPLVKASQFGIFVYDLQQDESLRAKALKINDPWTINKPINDENWGLANVEGIEVHKAETSLPAPHSADLPSLLKTKTQVKNNKISTLAKLCYFIFVPLIYSEKKCILVKQRSSFPLSKWIKNTIKPFAIQKFLEKNTPKSVIDAQTPHNAKDIETVFITDYFDIQLIRQQMADLYLEGSLLFESKVKSFCVSPFFVFVCMCYAKLKPVRILNLNTNNQKALKTLSFLDPTLQITTYFDLQEDNPKSCVHYWPKFKGYFHQLTGAQDTVFSRLKNMELMSKPYDMLVLDLAYWDKLSPEVIEEMIPLLAETSSILVLAENTDAQYKKSVLNMLVNSNFNLQAATPPFYLLTRDPKNCV